MPDARTSDSSSGGTRGRNTPATVGLVLGIVAMVVNPVLLVGAGAIVVSGVGLNRANLMSQFGYAPIGKQRAIWGVALGLLAIFASVAFKSSRF